MSNEERCKKYLALQNGSDIRGVAMEGIEGQEVNLSKTELTAICQAFVRWLSIDTKKQVEGLVVAVGRDSRLTGNLLMEAAALAMGQKGVKVLKTGLSSTPAMFMATIFPQSNADGSIMITASHLPFNRNGLKFFTKNGGLNKEDITEILETAAHLHCDEGITNKNLTQAKVLNNIANPDDPDSLGSDLKIESFNLMSLYSDHLKNIIRSRFGSDIDGNKESAQSSSKDDSPLAGLKIIVDAANGSGGFFAKSVLAPLGADTEGSLFLEEDGNFPNHSPNPEDPAAMAFFSKKVLEAQADLGLIFDTDADRLGAVDKLGKEISRNRMVALASVLAKEKSPGTTVVTDSITSTQLSYFLEDTLGLKHHRFKRGYKNVINEAIRLNNEGEDAFLAIETSGHAAFKDNYFLDDGAYLATLLVIKAAQLLAENKSIDSLLTDLNEPLEAIEVRIPIADLDFTHVGDMVLKELEDYIISLNNPEISIVSPNYEGVRVNLGKGMGDGWFLLRKSLHDPILPLNIESNSPGGVKKIKSILTPFLEKYYHLNLTVF